jgi:hypothetical protein
LLSAAPAGAVSSATPVATPITSQAQLQRYLNDTPLSQSPCAICRPALDTLRQHHHTDGVGLARNK